MGTMTFALERPGHYFCEKRTGLYKKYCLEVSQLKNVLTANDTLHWQAMPGLGGGA